LAEYSSAAERLGDEMGLALDSPADLTSPTGEAMAGVLAVFAQLDRRLIGERTREALAIKRESGVRLGRPRLIDPASRTGSSR
jgi:DNA invertase Pin-like site-specific DNA recombinase